MDKRTRVLVVTTLAAVLVAFGVFIWPTAYRSVPVKSRGVLAAREQRWTHDVDVLTRTGWHRLAPDTTDPVRDYLAKYGKGDTTGRARP